MIETNLELKYVCFTVCVKDSGRIASKRVPELI